MPKRSCSTFASGARQLVVHDALEMIWCVAGSYFSSLTPRTTVMSGPLAGAVITTFLAPASRCLAAASRLVNSPVDSTTTSTPRSFHGSSAGSRTARPLKPLPSTTISSSVEDTENGRRPRIESYLSRCASVALSVMSLTATISISVLPACFCASTARQKLRPIRPNPLTPTRTVTPCLLARKYLVVPHPSVRMPSSDREPRNRSTVGSVSPASLVALPLNKGGHDDEHETSGVRSVARQRHGAGPPRASADTRRGAARQA